MINYDKASYQRARKNTGYNYYFSEKLLNSK